MPHRTFQISWLPASPKTWATFSAARQEAARLWNDLVSWHAEARQQHALDPTFVFPSEKQWRQRCQRQYPNLHSHSVQETIHERRLSTWVRQTFGEITEGHFPSRAGLPEQPRRPALRSAETVPRGTWRSLQLGLGRRAGLLVPGANKSLPGSRSSLSDACPFLTIPPALSVVG